MKNILTSFDADEETFLFNVLMYLRITSIDIYNGWLSKIEVYFGFWSDMKTM